MELLQEPAPSISVFLVSDYRILVWGLEHLINGSAPAFQVAGSAASCADALERIAATRADLLLIDMDLGPRQVIEAIPDFLARASAKILLLMRGHDPALLDKAVLAGARGVLEKEASADLLLKALAKVHDGQMWLDREATGRIFVELSRRNAPRSADPEKQRIALLTSREQEIIACVAGNMGDPGKAIAGRLHISESTLRNHLSSIYEKLGVANRHGLLAYALKHGLIKHLP